MQAIEEALVASLADPGDVGQPAGMKGPGPAGDGHRHTIEDLVILGRAQTPGHRLLKEDQGAPDPTQTAIERTLTGHAGKQGPEVGQGVAHELAFGLPGYPVAP